ncbi:MAG: autotransporter-associated beta strand repeat-containing protein [Verrucomicrobiota bacterium]
MKSNLNRNGTKSLVAVALALANLSALAVDRNWSGGTASYTNAANWTGGVVPGVADKAINDNGAGNAVQINVGDPDWIVNGILAGKSTGNGAFVQNGQNVYLTNATGRGAVRLGVAANRSGAYTLNGGALNYSGEFNVGELGTATLNVYGGSITGNGNLAINIGSSLETVTATYGGTNKSDYTWFEQGFYTLDPSRGIPAAGSTFASETLPDHSFTMPASYAANNAVQVFNGLSNATINFTTPTAATALSFLGSAGFGTANVNYTVHHADTTTQSGTLALLDWFDNAGVVAARPGGRISANGLQIQIINDGPNKPYLVSLDLAIANTTSPITSVDLTYTSGGVANILAVSSSTGGNFTPKTITGYNQDIVVETSAPIYVASTVTNVLNQTAGTINITGEMFVGNVGAGIYNLSGGTNTVANWIGVGRSGGNGVLNMTGGVLNKTGGGNLIQASYQNLPGHDVSGILNHSGGTINMQSGEVWVPEGSSGFGTVSGTYNLSGTAVMNVSSWFAIGRNGASGTLNMTGGTINKTGGGQPAIIIADGGGAVGQATQSAGTINSSSELWIGQNGGSGTYNLSGTGALNVNNWLAIGRAGNGANGSLTMTGGSLNQAVNGVFIVGDNSQGAFLHSAGPVTAREFWVGNGGGGNGNYDLSGSASLTVNGWVVIGRDGTGIMNMSGGTFTKTGDAGNHLIIASGGNGGLNQTGGNVISTLSDTWVAENGTATWTISGGSATLSLMQLGRNGAGSGTFNLYGGTLTAKEIAGGSGNAAFNFGGGTLVAGASGNLMHDLDVVNVEAGGAIINTAGYNVTVASALLDNGGGTLTKNGLGSLTLAGPNTYVGATTVNAGKLIMTTASTGAGSFAVASGAGLGVQVAVDNGQLPAASVSFAGATSTLDMDLSSFGSPGAAPLAIAGALNVNGTVTVNILASSALQIGVYPLVSSGSRSGAGTFALGTLPLNTVATLVDNGTTINLNITDVNAPRWEGLAGGNWDIGLTTNWINGGSGLPTFFSEGSEVLFNDAAQGTTSVKLVATVHPTSVTVNNTNLSYTLSGSGKISGTTGLAKQGTGTLTIANNNDFTGATVISAGVVSVTNLANTGSPSPIGSGNLVLAGGTLSYAGPAATINRGYSVQGSGSSIQTVNNLKLSGQVTAASGAGFTKSGPGQLTYATVGSNALAGAQYLVTDGSVVFDGTAGGQTNTVQGSLGVAGATANATVVLTNTLVTTSGNTDVGIVMASTGTLNISTNSTLNVGSWFTMGDKTNATSTVNLNGGNITVNNGRLFLCSAPGTISTLNINGGTITKNGDYFAVVNGGWNGGGARTGVVNQVNGTVGGGSELWVGDGGGIDGNTSLGIYNLSGGTLTVNNWMGVGRDGSQGIFNLTGGTLNKGGGGDLVVGRGGNGTTGTLNMSGGTLNKGNNNPMIIGQDGGVGTFNQSAGALDSGNEFWVGQGNGGTGTYNFSGGTHIVRFWTAIGRGGGNGTVNMTGGTFTKVGDGQFIVGDNSTGLFNQSGSSTLSINNELWIGQAGGGTGVFNLTNGTVSIGSWLAVGRESGQGVLNIYGGSMTKSGGGNISITHNDNAHGTVNMYGGAFTNTTSETWVGENGGNTAKGEWNMYGGTAVLGVVHLANASDVMGQMNLNGGSLTATEISTGNNAAPQRELNFNGGTLAAGANNANFIRNLSAANVQAGGAVINSAGYTIGISQALLDGGTGGGLNKTGNGTLNLNGVNTYTGTTLVSQGALGGTGTIAGPVSVASGGTLAPGNSIGTLTINNTLGLAAGSTTAMEISSTGGSDLVTGATTITYGGTLVIKNLGGLLASTNTFKLFNAASYNGSFSSVVSQTPGQTRHVGHKQTDRGWHDQGALGCR